ncbi:hypothetical protein P8C59_007317 [Phyllachora maydis]|uniref:Deacetylase sirtuin-type domain-containing protein n=1 Tax=Phyllachora maydis TaxID=1825666 RepID=A0AAD9I8N6_9PEZI|nr:hypothetical protein P8C59_007317 [Phyllachora maydis]
MGGMDGGALAIEVRVDGPPAKRRRIATSRPPRVRITEFVDLENRDEAQERQLDRLIHALRKKKRIVVIAGAGISVSAGIPDFRSTSGLYATSGKHLFDASVYKDNQTTSSFHDMVRTLAQKASEARPTPFHHMLASTAKEGRLLRLYSQNVDCIETKMAPLATTVPLNSKGPWPKTIQLHGGLENMVCTKCQVLKPFVASLFEGPEPPLCQDCKEVDEVRTQHAGKRSHGIGRLRPRIVLYNEFNTPDQDAIGRVCKADLQRVPDAVIVVGTSLKVPGARRLVKEMCQLTRSRRDGVTAWINIDPEPQGPEFKDCWDFVVKGKCDHVAELVNLPRWDQQDIGDAENYMVSGDETKERRFQANLSRHKIDVLLPQTEHKQAAEAIPVGTPTDKKSKLVAQVQGGIPTPRASPSLRVPLPASKPAGKATKQSTLDFAVKGAKNLERVAEPAPAKAKRGRPRQKKEPVSVNRSLTQAFKATKNVGPAAKASTKDHASARQRPDISSPLSSAASPPASALPALRPVAVSKQDGASPPLVTFNGGDTDTSSELSMLSSSASSTPTMVQARLSLTTSPGLKPQRMRHQID